MIAVDTNVLVRFITHDHKQQTRLAEKLLLSRSGEHGVIYISDVVLCELVWVLKSGYGYKRNQISKVLFLLLDIDEFCFSQVDWLFEAATLYESKNIDFFDCLISVFSEKNGCQHIYSFDQKGVQQGLFSPMT